MPEKEKVMTITLMRTDLYDAPGYSGTYIAHTLLFRQARGNCRCKSQAEFS